MSLETLLCTKCQKVQPVTAFSKDKRRKDRGGYHGWCKSCRNRVSVAEYHAIILDESVFNDGAHGILSCRLCSEVKPATDFTKDKRQKARGYRDSVCRTCKNAQLKTWIHANREHVNAQNSINARKRRAANPEAARIKSKRKSQQFRLQNPLYHSQWSRNNRPALRAALKRYAEKHPAKFRAKKRRLSITYAARRRARLHCLPATFTPAEESFCRAYFHQACAICGNEEGFQWTIAMDHWIPLSSKDCPGTIATNMIPLCHGLGGCNNTSKRHKAPEQWLLERFGTRKAALILKRIHAYFAVVADRQEKAS